MTDGLCTKSRSAEVSLCNLCGLCVSVVFCSEFINHRDTETTEVAQRKALLDFLLQSLTDGSSVILLTN